jgi:hypothetical protein
LDQSQSTTRSIISERKKQEARSRDIDKMLEKDSKSHGPLFSDFDSELKSLLLVSEYMCNFSTWSYMEDNGGLYGDAMYINHLFPSQTP